MSSVAIRQRPSKEIDRSWWDSFAAETKASYQVGVDHLRANSLKAVGRAKHLYFEFFTRESGEEQKVGQCVVMKRGRRFRIQDGLQMVSEDPQIWRDAMNGLLRKLGPGDFIYGGLWNCEVARQDELATLPGVRIENVRPFTVQAVDFSRWPSWDRYWAKVSENVRRNARYALERAPGLHVKRYTGFAMLRKIPMLVQLQQESLSRKSLTVRAFRQSLQYLYYMAVCDRIYEVNFAVGDDGVIASYYGAQLGGNFYYIYGGQRAGGSGANWFLMQHMARIAYERCPTGRLVMGNVDYATHDENVGGGLLRARRSLRVTDYETSIIRFSYR